MILSFVVSRFDALAARMRAYAEARVHPQLPADMSVICFYPMSKARGETRNWYTLPFEERKLQSRKEFLDDIAVSLGGYVAERMVFGDLTTGAGNTADGQSALFSNTTGASRKRGGAPSIESQTSRPASI